MKNKHYLTIGFVFALVLASTAAWAEAEVSNECLPKESKLMSKGYDRGYWYGDSNEATAPRTVDCPGSHSVERALFQSCYFAKERHYCMLNTYCCPK